MDLIYTQAHGYAAYTGKTSRDFPELAAIVDYKDEIASMGYVRQWGSPSAGDGHGDECEGFALDGPNKYGFPRYLVTLWDDHLGTHIYCEDPGDFFALRMEMGRNQLVASPLLLEILEIAKKAFRAQHGHDYDSFCKTCDPEAWRVHQEWEASQRGKR